MIAVEAYYQDDSPVILRTADDIAALLTQVRADSRSHGCPPVDALVCPG